MHRRLLLDAAPADGNGPPNTPAAPAAPPPAAKLVVESGARESDAGELVEERRKREEAERKVKEREIELAHLQDENHRLKSVPAAPAPAPKQERKPGWFDAYRSDEDLGAD